MEGREARLTTAKGDQGQGHINRGARCKTSLVIRETTGSLDGHSYVLCLMMVVNLVYKFSFLSATDHCEVSG